MDYHDDFLSWLQIIKTILAENGNLQPFYSSITNLIYEIIENGSIQEPFSSYTDEFLSDIFIKFTEKILSFQTQVFQEKEALIQYLMTSLLLFHFIISHQKTDLLWIFSHILQKNCNLYLNNPDMYNKIYYFFLDCGNLSFLYESLNKNLNEALLCFSLEISKTVVNECYNEIMKKNKTDDLDISWANAVFDVFPSLCNFLEQYKTEETIQQLNIQSLSNIFVNLQNVLYYNECIAIQINTINQKTNENNGIPFSVKELRYNDINIVPFLDFCLFYLDNPKINIKLIGIHFIDDVSSLSTLKDQILKWDHFDELKYKLILNDFHPEVIKSSFKFFNFLGSNKKISNEDMIKLYNHAVICHTSIKANYYTIITNLFWFFDENQITAFLQTQNITIDLIQLLEKGVIQFQYAKQQIGFFLFSILFEIHLKLCNSIESTHIFEIQQSKLHLTNKQQIDSVILRIVSQIINHTLRSSIIEFCVSYLEDEFIIQILSKIIQAIPLGNSQFYDEDILPILIVQLNQNIKGVFRVITEIHLKFKKTIDYDELNNIINELDINNIVDDFWIFLSNVIKALSVDSLLSNSFEFFFLLIRSHSNYSKAFLEFVHYFLLLYNFKNNVLVLNNGTNVQFNQLNDFSITQLPVSGIDILWNIFIYSRSNSIAQAAEESILFFSTNVRGFTTEYISQNFFMFVVPIITLPTFSNENKIKGLEILLKFIQSVEKDEDNFDLGLLRHCQAYQYKIKNMLNSVQLYQVSGGGFHCQMFFKDTITDQEIYQKLKKYYISGEFSFEVKHNEKLINVREVQNSHSETSIPKIPSILLTQQNFAQYLVSLFSFGKDFEDICWEILQVLETNNDIIKSINSEDKIKSVFQKSSSVKELRFYIQTLIIHSDVIDNHILHFFIDIYNSYDDINIRCDILHLFNQCNIDNSFIEQLITILFSKIEENTNEKLELIHSLLRNMKFLTQISNDISKVIQYIKVSKNIDDCLAIVSNTNIFDFLAQFVRMKNFYQFSSFIPLLNMLYPRYKDSFDFSFLCDFCFNKIDHLIQDKNMFYKTKIIDDDIYCIINNQTKNRNLKFDHDIPQICDIVEIINSRKITSQYLKSLLKVVYESSNPEISKSLGKLYISLRNQLLIQNKSNDNILIIDSELFDFENEYFRNFFPIISKDVLSIGIRDPGTFAGLKNVNISCFSNSVLQQLFSIVQFKKKLFLSTSENIYDNFLLNIFAELSLTIKKFVNTQSFNELFPNFICGTQQDAAEFLTILLDNLSSELSDIFHGEIESKITVKDEENLILENGIDYQNLSGTNIDSFFLFPLSGENFINQYNNEENDNKIFEQREIIMDYCFENTKVHCDVIKSSHLRKSPNVLILQLKRFDYNLHTSQKYKINTSFQFPYELNILPNESDVLKYQLKGIISHLGHPDFGHYISYVKYDRNWVLFDDTIVKELSELPTEIHSTAYLLFYHIVDNEAEKYDSELELNSNIVEKITNDNTDFLKQIHSFSYETYQLISLSNDFEVLLNYFFNVLVFTQFNPDDICLKIYGILLNDTSCTESFLLYIETNFGKIFSLFSLNNQQFLPSFISLCSTINSSNDNTFNDRLLDFCNKLLEVPYLNFNISLFLYQVISESKSLVILAEKANWIEKLYQILKLTHNFDIQFFLKLLLVVDHSIENPTITYSFEHILSNNSSPLFNRVNYLNFLISVFPRVDFDLNKLIYFISTVNSQTRMELLLDLLLNESMSNEEDIQIITQKIIQNGDPTIFLLNKLSNQTSSGFIASIKQKNIFEFLMSHFGDILSFYFVHQSKEIRINANKITLELANYNINSLFEKLVILLNQSFSLIENEYRDDNDRLCQISECVINIINNNCLTNQEFLHSEVFAIETFYNSILKILDYCQGMKAKNDFNIFGFLSLLFEIIQNFNSDSDEEKLLHIFNISLDQVFNYIFNTNLQQKYLAIIMDLYKFARQKDFRGLIIHTISSIMSQSIMPSNLTQSVFKKENNDAYHFGTFSRFINGLFIDLENDFTTEIFLTIMNSIPGFGENQLNLDECKKLYSLAYIVNKKQNISKDLILLLPFSYENADDFIGNFPFEKKIIFEM